MVSPSRSLACGRGHGGRRNGHDIDKPALGGQDSLHGEIRRVVHTDLKAQAILPPSATRYRTTLEAFYTIYKNEGLSAFYKGLTPSLFGVSHVAVQFGLYEKTKAMACELGS